MSNINLAFKLGVAYGIGRAFAKSQTMAQDASMRDRKKIAYWKTIRGNKVPFDKDENPLSEVGKKIVGIKRKDPGVKSGRDAHNSAKSHKTPKGSEALFEYTKDGKDGLNVRLNKGLRAKRQHFGDDEQSRWALWEQLASSSIKDPIRVYRGLSEKYGKPVLDTYEYSDEAYLSTSTSRARARRYSAKSKKARDNKTEKYVLVIDLPKGYNGISVSDITAKKKDKEILLKAGIELKVFNVYYSDATGTNYIQCELK